METDSFEIHFAFPRDKHLDLRYLTGFGKDRQTLFITANTSLYSIRMNVKGANPTK